MRKPEVGDRVRIISIDQKGTIDFILWGGSLNEDWLPRIQIALDDPYWEGPASMSHCGSYRTTLNDLKFLKKKVQEEEKAVKKKKSPKKISDDDFW